MSEFTRRDLLRTGLVLSAGSLVSNAIADEQTAPAVPAAPMRSGLGGGSAAAIRPRERLLLDLGWKFHLGSDSAPLRNLGAGDGLDAFSKTGSFEFATAKLDDSQWRSLHLPHDWAVELPFVHDEELQSHGYKPLGRNYRETSIGWYRRAFPLPAADAGRRIVLELDGVFRSAMVFVNGCYIGRSDTGYVPFRFDLTDFLIYGDVNFIVVRVDATYGEGWFYEGAGIYRQVWLTKTDPLHLGDHESYARCEVKRELTELSLGTRVENQGHEAEEARVHWQILDADGRAVASAASRPQLIGPGGSASFITAAALHAPKLWSPEAPYLYSAVVTVEGGGRAGDAERVDFGVRTVEFDPERGLLLNGKVVKIKGTCNMMTTPGSAPPSPIACTSTVLRCCARWAPMRCARPTTCLHPNGWRLAIGWA